MDLERRYILFNLIFLESQESKDWLGVSENQFLNAS